MEQKHAQTCTWKCETSIWKGVPVPTRNRSDCQIQREQNILHTLCTLLLQLVLSNMVGFRMLQCWESRTHCLVVSRRYRLIFLELHWQTPCLPQTEYSTYCTANNIDFIGGLHLQLSNTILEKNRYPCSKLFLVSHLLSMCCSAYTEMKKDM